MDIQLYYSLIIHQGIVFSNRHKYYQITKWCFYFVLVKINHLQKQYKSSTTQKRLRKELEFCTSQDVSSFLFTTNLLITIKVKKERIPIKCENLCKSLPLDEFPQSGNSGIKGIRKNTLSLFVILALKFPQSPKISLSAAFHFLQVCTPH